MLSEYMINNKQSMTDGIIAVVCIITMKKIYLNRSETLALAVIVGASI